MTKEIQFSLARHLILLGHEAVCENFGYLFEMDVASLSKNGMLHEFEVKISRSDFLADKNKVKKFLLYGNSQYNSFKCPNYFYYVCPENLIEVSDIPLYAGLYYYSDGIMWLKKGAKKLHSTPADKVDVLKKMLRMTVQRKYIGCTMLTYKNSQIKEHNRQRINL